MMMRKKKSIWNWKFLNDDYETADRPTFSFGACAEKIPFVLFHENEGNIQVPGSMAQYLRDYQREGIRFMYSHYMKNEGAILGDDMGLGKTVQVISFLAAILGKTGTWRDKDGLLPDFLRKYSDPTFKESEHLSFLVIVPASVMFNWMDEFETWGYFSVGRYHKDFRMQTLRKAQNERLEVVLTSFETARDHLGRLNNVNWAAVFVDEVHKVKEPKSQVTIALKGLKCKRRFGLTGTALQNNLKELWCILDWANPGCLGDMVDFLDKYANAIEKGQRHMATKRELAEARKKKEELQLIVRKWMIRRTKACISDQLPKKMDRVVLCRPSPLQVSIFKAIFNMKEVQLVTQQWDPCTCGSGSTKGKCCFKKDKNGRSMKALIFTVMHLLLKAANHIGLLMPSETTAANQLIMAKKIWRLIIKEHSEYSGKSEDDVKYTLSKPKHSGKMVVLASLLEVFHKRKDKVLLFSYSTCLLTILEKYIQTLRYEYRRIDGNTKLELRSQYVKEFNAQEKIFLFLISTKAGGLGLNITGANVVVIFDPNWNPSHDLQAQDRAYRIGQRRNVSVYRLITAGTIEENMYLRQVYKQQLENVVMGSDNARRYFHGVQGDQDNRGELFGIRNMFTFCTGRSCLTEDILCRNEKIEEDLQKPNSDLFVVAQCQLNNDHKNFVDNEDEESDDDDDSDEDMSDTDPYGLVNQFGEEIAESTPAKDSKGKSKLHLPRQTLSSSDDDSSEESNIALKKDPKLKLLELSSSDDDDSDCLEKHTGGQNPIEKILKSSRVVHTHLNQEIVGGSKVEDHISRCAAKSVYEHKTGSQELAINCDPMTVLTDHGFKTNRFRERRKRKLQMMKRRAQWINLNSARIVNVADQRIHYGQTPKSVKRKHFEEMAQFQGLPVVSLAEKILQMSDKEKVQFLQKFYIQKISNVGNFFEELLVNVHVEETTEEDEQDWGDYKEKSSTGRKHKKVHKKLRSQKDKYGTVSLGESSKEVISSTKKHDISREENFTALKPKETPSRPLSKIETYLRHRHIPGSAFLNTLVNFNIPSKPPPKKNKRYSEKCSSEENSDGSFLHKSPNSHRSSCSAGATHAFNVLDELFFSNDSKNDTT